ncbi:hypothetical protein [Isoptericola dokdonensis]|uniref:hypothetical protein n=1 Tax=Isoptericola dokdonensis TaxID=372663 RepID=UPI00082A22EE|nr:hypothetical protein [Isoptericola dokdonensis]
MQPMTSAGADAPTPEELAAHISVQFDRWGRRVVAPASCEITPGSDLARDGSRKLPGGRVLGKVVWRALATAGEHAAAAGHLLRAYDNAVFAKPNLTWARTTLVGAAKALYVLDPDDADERRVRALRLLRAESADVHRLIKVWQGEGALDQELSKAADELQQDSEAALVSMQQKPGSQISESALLEAVAHHLDGGPANPLARVQELWNTTSGIAHARTWAWDTGLEDSTGAEQVVRIWILPIDLMYSAWELWNQRRGKG